MVFGRPTCEGQIGEAISLAWQLCDWPGSLNTGPADGTGPSGVTMAWGQSVISEYWQSPSGLADRRNAGGTEADQHMLLC
jgi:hypothetical protein